MTKQNRKSEIVIYIYKFLVYTLNLAVFVFFMMNINEGLGKLTRTSVVTVFIFYFTILLLGPVYGNFEIGQRKSKPVIYSSVVVILFTDFMTYLFLLIMGANQFTLSEAFGTGFMYLLLTFIVQTFLIILCAYLGNYIFFKLNKPSRTLIVYSDSELEVKINKYVSSLKKQYLLVDSIKESDFEKIMTADLDTIFLIGVGKNFRNDMIELCFYDSINLYFNADIYDVMSGKNRTTVYDDVLLVEYTTTKITLLQSFMKRSIDILFSSVFCILASPVFLIVAIAIKIDDGGPVFYSQERITADSRVFKIYKFRSMKTDSGDKPATVNDSRITNVGKVLRKLRIDELPQFLNILIGDMSLVGPRPESISLMEDITDDLPQFTYRLKVKAGLTGYAQIFGKYNTSPKQKLLMDLKYIETYSVLNDIKLIFQTINVFFKSDSTEGFED